MFYFLIVQIRCRLIGKGRTNLNVKPCLYYFFPPTFCTYPCTTQMAVGYINDVQRWIVSIGKDQVNTKSNIFQYKVENCVPKLDKIT